MHEQQSWWRRIAWPFLNNTNSFGPHLGTWVLNFVNVIAIGVVVWLYSSVWVPAGEDAKQRNQLCQELGFRLDGAQRKLGDHDIDNARHYLNGEMQESSNLYVHEKLGGRPLVSLLYELKAFSANIDRQSLEDASNLGALDEAGLSSLANRLRSATSQNSGWALVTLNIAGQLFLLVGVVLLWTFGIGRRRRLSAWGFTWLACLTIGILLQVIGSLLR